MRNIYIKTKTGKIVKQARDIYLKTVTRNLRQYILRTKFYET